MDGFGLGRRVLAHTADWVGCVLVGVETLYVSKQTEIHTMIQAHLQPGSLVQVGQQFFPPRSWDGSRLTRLGEPALYACLVVGIEENKEHDEDAPEFVLERVLDGAQLTLAADYFIPGAISQH